MASEAVAGYAGKRVLVTGASGFIGSHLVALLVRSGAAVYAGCRSPLKFATCSGAVAGVVKGMVSLDVADRLAVDKTVSGLAPDVVFHLAARLGHERMVEEFDRQTEVTFAGAVNIGLACLRHGVPLLVHVGSSEEYGDGRVPFRETQRERPISPYSAAKVAATQYLIALKRMSGLPVVILRPTVVYGPGQLSDMLISQLFQCYLSGQPAKLTPGEQTRDFVYVGDVVRGLALAGLQPALAGEIINIAFARSYTVRTVARMVADLCRFRGDLGLGTRPYRQLEVMRHRASNDLAGRLLDWRPETDLRTGLALTMEWFKSRHL